MKKSHLHPIKESGFNTPESYFDNFEERLFEKMAVQKKLELIKAPGYKVPERYFTDLEHTITDRITAHPSSKTRRFISWKNTVLVSGIAASLLLMVAFFTKSNDTLSINQIETASIEAYLTNENLSLYDITSLLNEDDLNMDNFVINALSEESLEDYLINHASIEDLIHLK